MTTRRNLLAAPALLLPGPAVASDSRETWTDPARRRALPVLVRLPPAATPAPLVVLSHGLYGSRDGLGYLGSALATAGFACVHVQHPGSDIVAFEEAANERAARARAYTQVQGQARIADLGFAIDQARQRLPGRIAEGPAFAVGYSFGAWAVQMMVGQRLGGATSPDPRLGAAIIISASPYSDLRPGAMDAVRIPLLFLSGTRDGDTLRPMPPVARLEPYRLVRLSPAVLAVLAGATHYDFAGEGRLGTTAYHARIAALSVAFLTAVLGGTAAIARTGLAPADRLEAKGGWRVLG